MKNLITIIVISASCLLVQQYLPWWTALIVIALFSALMKIKPSKASLFGSFILGTMWLFYAMYLNFTNNGIIANRIGELFKGLSPAQLISFTGFLGVLMGGLSGLTGSLFVKAMIKGK